MKGNTPLSAEEREAISRELTTQRSCREIGRFLGWHHSVIAREVERNGGAAEYRAAAAQQRAPETRKRPKLRKLVRNNRLHEFARDRMSRKWSSLGEVRSQPDRSGGRVLSPALLGKQSAIPALSWWKQSRWSIAR
ncbi:helix-turn-helix domain-containing protein [Sinosporangium siamense]|uniref:helix-turn-helix domain-containing protein n=1 Tax=Sinosporangium siamense TaxID=1367973 RepID=UPI0019526494